jgi:hypothetical protein
LDGWRSDFQEISWVEAAAVELAVRLIDVWGWSNLHVLLCSDNQGIIGAYQWGWEHNPEINDSVQHVDVITSTWNFSFSFTYVKSEANLADPVLWVNQICNFLMSCSPLSSPNTWSVFMANTPDFLQGVLAIADTALSGTTSWSPEVGRLRISRSETLNSWIWKARKPKEGCRITPSVFRPHVLASDRLGLWKTPHGQLYATSIEQYLPKSVCTLLFNISLSSFEEKTHSNYRAGLLWFTQFCNAFNIPKALRMPAPKWLLAAFTAVAAGSVSRSCVDGWLSGIYLFIYFPSYLLC